MARQPIIAGIIGLGIIANLAVGGGFPPGIAITTSILGAVVILMISIQGWPDLRRTRKSPGAGRQTGASGPGCARGCSRASHSQAAASM
jgi:hypothetical protein